MPITYQLLVGGGPGVTGTNYSDETIEGLSINYGRTSVTQDPQPTTLSARLLHSSNIGNVDLKVVAPNSRIAFQWINLGNAYVRFVGIITDVSVDKNIVSLNAVSTGIYVLNRLELDSWDTFAGTNQGQSFGRVAQQLVAIGLNAANLDVDESQLPSVAREFPVPTDSELIWDSYTGDPRSIGAVLNEYANQTRGRQLWDTFDYGTRKSPPSTNQFYVELYENGPSTNTTPVLILTDDEVGYYWATDTDTAVSNTETVVDYTPSPSLTESPASGTVTATNPRYNTISQLRTNITAQLEEDSATRVALWNVNRGYRPSQIVTVDLPMSTFSIARQEAIVDKLVGGNLWELPQLNPALPTLWYVQGYTERYKRKDWTIRVRLAGLGALWWGQPWDDVTASLEWHDVNAAVTWLDLVETIL